MTEIIVTKHGTWAEITFNRPERRNAINLEFAQQFLAGLVELDAMAELRAIVLSGAGGAYCSGLDLKALNPPPPWRAELAAIVRRYQTVMMQTTKVLIVALEGGAINAGAALAFVGDLLVAGRSAFIQVGELQRGMPIPFNTSWLVLRHGEAVAARFCFMAERVGADDLYRLGVATEVVDDKEVLNRARALAERIGGFPAEGLAIAKRGIRATSRHMTPEEWFDLAAPPAAMQSFAPERVKG